MDTKSRMLQISMSFSVVVVLYHLIMVGNLPARFKFFVPDQIHTAISMTCAVIIIFLTSGARRLRSDKLIREDQGWKIRRVPWFDYFFIVCLVAANGYVIFFNDRIDSYAMFGYLDSIGMILAALLGIVVLEAVRRSTGPALPAMIIVFVLMTIFQQYLPGILYGLGTDLDRLLYAAYAGDSGFYGQPLRVATTIILVYLIFGAVMQSIGAGQWAIDIALALTGRSRGGPAKGAALASALFGSISGSPSSNVATTGVFTIPLMKSVGYKPVFAGAVESVASTGGQILPPVMGAIAFVMADWIGVDYVEVVIAATLPALLYYLILLASIHFQARKDNLDIVVESRGPALKPLLIQGIHYFIPIVVLLYFLLGRSYPPEIAGIYAIAAAIASSFLSRDRNKWITWSKLSFACHQTIGRWVGIVAITAAVGLMIGALEFSGLGIKLSAFAVDLSGGDIFLALLLVGIASLLIGMGLDAIPAYLTLATLLAPALIQLGVSELAAHLFVVYWGLASFFTPPMCIAVYVAVTISGSRIWETGWEAVKLGIAAFIVPFAFVLNEALIMNGGIIEIMRSFIMAAIGSVVLAAAIRGYWRYSLGVASRLFLAIAAFLLITPGETVIGILMIIVILAGHSLYRQLSYR